MLKENATVEIQGAFSETSKTKCKERMESYGFRALSDKCGIARLFVRAIIVPLTFSLSSEETFD